MDDLGNRVDLWLASQLPPAHSTAANLVNPFATQLITDLWGEVGRLRSLAGATSAGKSYRDITKSLGSEPAGKHADC